MYASVSSAHIQPGKLDEFLSIYQESVLPAVKELPGVKHLYVLTDAETNYGLTIALYDTKADAERTQTSGDFQKLVGQLVDTIITETLERKGYEVSLQG